MCLDHDILFVTPEKLEDDIHPLLAGFVGVVPASHPNFAYFMLALHPKSVIFSSTPQLQCLHVSNALRKPRSPCCPALGTSCLRHVLELRTPFGWNLLVL